MTKLQSGTLITNTYRLEKMLGQGGMGQVWLATHTLLNEPRAIKFFHTSLQNDPQLIQRFIHGEARNSLKLPVHPNLVRVFELGQTEDSPYIVMEYIEGNSAGANLKDYLANLKLLDPPTVAKILEQLAEGLSVAHAYSMIHRDIKPANILITPQGNLKITDFGIVKNLESAPNLTLGGYSMGTPAYMSPEQAEGKATQQSDIYSLGIVVYELLSGRVPFSGTAAAILIQHATSEPPPLAHFGEALNAVVLKALAKTPGERYASVFEFSKAFNQALASLEPLPAMEQTVAIQTSEPMPLPNTPTPSVVATTGSTPNNLFSTSNELLGREKEVEQITALLEQDKTRLVTLTGVGGTGKTRLSLAVARQLLSHFKDGVYFIPLEEISQREALLSAIAHTLEARQIPGQTLATSLKMILADKKMLLVLDNFEQLVQAAPVLSDLLKGLPDIKLLVTSRETLQISLEREYPVEPLSLPNLANLPENIEEYQQFTAILLFVERAKSVKPDFELTVENAPLIAQMCLALDGLPLAIELAAARVKILPPDKLLERLANRLKVLTGGARDLPGRQQTLRGAIDWSYDLLTPEERQFFNRLAVFANGCTFETAEQICNPDTELGI